MNRYDMNRVFLKRAKIPYTFYADVKRARNKQVSYGQNVQMLYDELPDLSTVDDIKLVDRRLDKLFRRTKFRRYLPDMR